MAGPLDNYELWSAEITLGAADATKTLLAAPAGNRKRIVVTHMVAFSLIAAAQLVDITIGTTNVMRLPATWAAASEHFFGPMLKGLRGQAGQALVIAPAAAGPSIHVIAEGYYET